MASKALRGDSDLTQIKLGAGRIYQGQTSSVVFDGTLKFDTITPPANWRDLGVIMQDVTLNLAATEFAFKTGLPSTRKKTFITGRDGTIQGTFAEFNALINQITMGLLAPINKLGASGPFTVAASPAPTSSTFTLDATTGLAVGDEVVVEAVAGSLAASNNRGIIKSITGLDIVVENPLYLTPASTWKVREVVSTKLVFGGGDVKTYPLLFVVDLLGGKQVTYFFPSVSSQGNHNPNFGGGTENMRNQIQFEAYGVLDTDINDMILAACFVFEA